jgi:hypothetical protein
MHRLRIAILSSLLALSPPLPGGIPPGDAALIVDTLLDLKSVAGHPSDAGSRAADNPLRAYQAWSALYEKYAQRDLEGDHFSEGRLRIYLLLGWVALEKLDAGTMEAFASDVLPLYEKRPDQVLRALRDAPFLVPSTCRYLNRHFGFEDKKRDIKQYFISANSDKIKNALAAEDAERCLRQFAE